ncbi:DWNN domain protein [Opisthorchis viverrini]|uniref:DWNN domain protein n=1 Tax=Opisthorchis viverrini TaxID=6198 RepID=A0A1S8WTN1_OPIVI|nr:DWNN domain protein [Opisthorchis viverrini]
MSSIVYFKFKANVKTDSIPFDGSSISVKDLKNAIRTKCCLHSTDFDLKLEDTNGKSYNKDDELIPKYTSIVVRRVPKLTTEVQKKKPYVPFFPRAHYS